MSEVYSYASKHTHRHTHTKTYAHRYTHTHEDVGALSNLAWLESYSQKQQLAAFWFELVGLRWGWGKQVE